MQFACHMELLCLHMLLPAGFVDGFNSRNFEWPRVMIPLLRISIIQRNLRISAVEKRTCVLRYFEVFWPAPYRFYSNPSSPAAISVTPWTHCPKVGG
jgi:hypothetical protein